jgi:hypothetical protein
VEMDSDVRDYLLSGLEDYPAGQRYTPEVAILELYQQADPRASPGQIQRIGDILQLHRNITTLLEDRRILRLEDGVAGPENAWGLAPNLMEAKKNLDLLLQQQVRLHGSRFSQRSYEIASLLASPQAGVQLDMAALKKTLQLPADFSLTELKRVMEVLRKSNADPRGGTYQKFLLNAFEDPSSLEARRARSLLTLIEFMEAVKSVGGNEKLWGELISAHVARFYGP